MCGIFGIILKPGTTYSAGSVKGSLKKIALFSESRGKDSSGIAFRDVQENSIEVIKGDIPVSELIKDDMYFKQLDASFNAYQKGDGFSVFGHARLVTNGSQLHEVNNQPVIKDGILVIHNGIIVNADELWEIHAGIKREYKIDTEIIPSLIRSGLDDKKDLLTSCNEAFNKLTGTYSVAMMLNDHDEFILATNNGSLYFITDYDTYFVFASESYFLDQLKREKAFSPFGGNLEVIPLGANQGIVVNMSTLKITPFSVLQEKNLPVLPSLEKPLKIEKHLLVNPDARYEVVIDPSIYINRTNEQQLFNLLEYNIDAIRSLRRCAMCLLPETFPFIEFDETGICNYCKNYSPRKSIQTVENLRTLVEPYRRTNGKHDCIVPLSGGRDSTFSLHFLKKEIGLSPLAYTYDWGMVTDLARRNIARICGKLGIEHIIIAADIYKKRAYIKQNINAWLKRPHLGMIPLFMSGDKAFHYHLIRLQKKTGISLNIWGENSLEKTDFKTGFAGIHPEFDKKVIYSLSLVNSLKLLGFITISTVLNPSYINSSIWDNLNAQYSRSFSRKTDYYNFYDYYRWDEDTIVSTIKDNYDWEFAIDTESSWRIGDGTSAFYNYIYYTVAGFSEFDTFRSNQIREGKMQREDALRLIYKENFPRYETIRWYLSILNLDFETVIKTINSIPKLYQK
jgi:glutamine---fructose-6-phosphate transaminase (isomerizing)